MDQGVVKTFDPVTGAGVVIRESDRSEVYLRKASLDGSMFRLLRQGQRIMFDGIEDDGRVFVSNIRMGQDGY